MTTNYINDMDLPLKNPRARLIFMTLATILILFLENIDDLAVYLNSYK